MQIAVAILRKEGLLARFALRLSDDLVNIPYPHIKRHLNSAIIQADRLAHFCKSEALIVNKALNGLSAAPIFLKGVAYVLQDNPLMYGRMFNDMDVLVAKTDIPKSEIALFSAGWVQQKMDNYDEKYYREWTHEIPPLIHSKRDTVIDLHHNLIPIISGRAPDIDLFFQGSIQTAHGMVLRPAALALHSIIHLFANEEFHNAFRDINDIYTLFCIHNNDAFWDDILRLARKTDFTDELFMALDSVQYLYNAQIPPKVLSLINKAVLKKHSKNKVKLWQFIYRLSLQPKHKLIKPKYASFALALAFLRGHMVKMPFKVLLPHIAYKLYRMATESLFGKGFGKEEMIKNAKP